MPFRKEIPSVAGCLTREKTIQGNTIFGYWPLEPAKNLVSPASDPQRSVYMEKIAVVDKPMLFQTEIEYISCAQSFQFTVEMVRPYQKESLLYKENTAEKPPQIIFNENIKSLARRILQDETNPLLQVQENLSVDQ